MFLLGFIWFLLRFYKVLLFLPGVYCFFYKVLLGFVIGFMVFFIMFCLKNQVLLFIFSKKKEEGFISFFLMVLFGFY